MNPKNPKSGLFVSNHGLESKPGSQLHEKLELAQLIENTETHMEAHNALVKRLREVQGQVDQSRLRLNKNPENLSDSELKALRKQLNELEKKAQRNYLRELP